MVARLRQLPAGIDFRAGRAAALDAVGSEPDNLDRRCSRQPRDADHRISAPRTTATERLCFQTYRALWSARPSPGLRAMFAFSQPKWFPLIWINAAAMKSGQNFAETSRAPCHGRHLDTPLSRPEDNRQSLSSRTQCRPGD